MTQPTQPYDGVGPVPISASQLTTFATCRRLWAYDKLDGVERPETDATNEGHAIHAEVEAYFKHGTAPERPEAKALLALCPPRAPHLVAEAEFTLAWPGEDALVRGKIDLVDPTQHLVLDHKTTSNIDRYAKTREDLELDAQAVLYGLAYRARFHNIPEVKLQWNYVKREQPRNRAPKTLPVDLVQTIPMLEAGLHHWAPVVTDLVQIAKRLPKAIDVPASPGDACFKYGGCHYRDRCPDYAGNRKKETPPVNPSVLAHLARLGAATPAPLPENEPPKAPETAADESKPLTPAATVIAPPAMPLLDSVRIALDIAPPVVPPDAQPDVTPTDPPPPPLVEVKRGRGRPKGSVKVAPVDPQIRVDGFSAPESPTEHPAPPVSESNNLRTFVVETIGLARDGTLDQRIEAAKLAVALLNLAKETSRG